MRKGNTWLLQRLVAGRWEPGRNGCGLQSIRSSKEPRRGEPCGRRQGIRGEAETHGVQQEFQLDQGCDLCWRPLGGLKAMGETAAGHWSELCTSLIQLCKWILKWSGYPEQEIVKSLEKDPLPFIIKEWVLFTSSVQSRKGIGTISFQVTGPWHPSPTTAVFWFTQKNASEPPTLFLKNLFYTFRS